MQNKSSKYMLKILSFGGAIAIFPFAVMRLWQGDLITGLVDMTMVIVMLVLGFVVHFTNRIELVRAGLTAIAFFGLLSVIYLKGASLVYWAYPTMVAAFFILPPLRALVITQIAVLVIAVTIFAELELSIFFMIIMTLLANNVFAYLFSTKMIQQRDQLARSNESLKTAMNEIKLLQGIIPICSYCHDIRDDQGAWDGVVEYISKHSEATFSHGVCPKCFEKEKQKIKKNKSYRQG